jgi:Potential Queuosine, Q, salvage protein family
MTESLQLHDSDEEETYFLEESDLLGVLSSTREVVEQGEQVWINIDRVQLLASQWMQQERDPLTCASPAWYERYHFNDHTERTVNWIVVLDAMNFCFWAEKKQPRWTIEYQGETLNGYLAEAAALTRAVEEQIPLWDAYYLSNMTSKDLAHILRGEQTIPLFEQRLQHVQEVGRVLLERFDGQFTHAIEQVEGNAVKLALLLATCFPSFNDVTYYRNRVVRFYKRAQICVADIHGAFGGKGWGAFSNFDQLTAFADYKVPQVLRHFGILEYHPTLAGRIDNQELLTAGSEEEIELRAATIWGCELLRREITRQGGGLTVSEIDLRLWLLGQHSTDMRPYHRTRTIYY